MTRTVALVQRRLVAYRVPLFERLREQLAAAGLELRLLHGQGRPEERARGDEVRLPWAQPLPTRYVAGLCLLPYGTAARGCELLVMPQENRIVHNLRWLWRPPAGVRTAFWGHARYLQAAGGAGPIVRQALLTHVDWWFAYTEGGARHLAAAGFPPERLTVLHNTTDLRALQRDLATVRGWTRAARLQALGLPAGEATGKHQGEREDEGPWGLYLGSLYAGKRLDLLLQAAARMQQRRPGFRLLVAGDGPMADAVRDARRQGLAVHLVGPVQGLRKACALALADLVINPGAVGLGVLDAFAAGLPLLVRQASLVAPEAEYLRHGENAWISEDAPEAFEQALDALAADLGLRARLARGAAASAPRFDIDAMAQRFALGLQQAADSPSRVPRG